MTSLKQRAIRGAMWTTAGFGAKYILRFGNNIVLTRLLQPEFFGLMALVTSFRMGLELFSDIGISQNIVNSKRGDESVFLNTAWSLQAIRGIVIWIACIFVSFPASWYYDEKRLLILIPISTLSSVFDGFSSTSVHTLHRQMELRKLSIYELTLQVSFIATLIVLCYYYPTIWSLAIGTAIAGLYKLVSSFWLIPNYSNRFQWEKAAVKEILSFGKWMFIASGLMFAAEQSDKLVLAKLLSFKLFGVYTVAYTLATIPKQIIRQLSFKVIFPAIAQQRDLPRNSLRIKIIKQRRLILLGCGVILAALVTVGDLVIRLLYDQRYIAATWMMPILCCGVWFSLLFYTTSPALLAIGKPLYAAQSNFARFTIIILAVPLAHQSFGELGAISVIAFSDFPLYIVNLYGLWREKLFCLSQDIQTTLFFIAILTLFLFIRYVLGFGLPIEQLI